MPTYALTCAECGNRFEMFLLRIIRDADKVCPKCGSSSVSTGVGGGVLSTKAGSASSCGPIGGYS